MIERKYEEVQILKIASMGLFCLLFIFMISNDNSIQKSVGFSLLSTGLFFIFSQAIRGKEPLIRDDRIQFPELWQYYTNNTVLPSGYKEIEAAVESGRDLDCIIEDLSDDGSLNESNKEEE